ncbi:MAG: hypothetical protein NTAFB05_27490 [Nitrobacter sp.]
MPATGTMGLGIRSVSGRMRKPRPAASTMALVGVTGILGEASGASWCFQAKRIPVRMNKTRQNKKLEPGFDSIKAGIALVDSLNNIMTGANRIDRSGDSRPA